MAVPVMGAIQGLAGIAGGIIGSKKRKQEQRAAQREYNQTKERMQNADTSNLYANQENVYEDLTVNTQEADYIAAQQNQGMANTMDALQQSAGGSGIAALAQSMANQQTSNAEAASVSIGQQEASNQAAERQMAGQLKQQEIQGAYQSRAAEKDKVDTMFGMAQQRLGAANAARQQATSSIIGGVTGLAGAAAGAGVGTGGFSMEKLMGG
jgi:hypothetical protein